MAVAPGGVGIIGADAFHDAQGWKVLLEGGYGGAEIRLEEQAFGFRILQDEGEFRHRQPPVEGQDRKAGADDAVKRLKKFVTVFCKDGDTRLMWQIKGEQAVRDLADAAVEFAIA